MADTNHTPGPWHVGHLGSDGNCQCRTIVDEGYAGGICTVHLGNGLPVGEGGNDAPPLEEAVANMHLIAAAPELLKALADLIDDLEIRSVKGVVNCSHGVYCNARQALAKAEARS